MVSVEIMLSIIFCAVPAFMRVDPQMASGPVTHSTATSACPEMAAGLTHEIAPVRAPTSRA